MVWKSPLRQHSRNDASGASSSRSQPMMKSPAENQVREIASRIGLLQDSEILATVCQKMRKEYVIEEWQLPALDSRQWEKLHAPIGLAVAVRHISTHQLREQRLQIPFRERVYNSAQIRIEEAKQETGIDEREREYASLSTDPSQEKGERRNEIIRKTTSDESSKIQYESTVEENFGSDFGGGNGDSDTAQKPSTTKTTVTVQAMIESINDTERGSINSLERGKATTPVTGEKKQDEVFLGSFSASRTDHDIWRKNKNVLEENQLETDSKAPEEVEEERGISKVEVIPIQRTACNEVKGTSHAGKVDILGIDCLSTSMEVEEMLEKESNTTEREDPPESSSSDSESEGNTNIFSGIGNSVSFSEDEEDESPVVRGTRNLDCLLGQLESMEGSAISNSDTAPDPLLIPDSVADDITVAVSNVSPECRKAASKKKNKMRKHRHESDGETSSFEIEATALNDILVQLPDDDHRAILSQLMIMTNARDKESRTTLAFQIQDSLVSLIEKNGIDTEPEKAVQLIFHLSRLKKSYRLIFGKSIFKAMSKLYKRTERLNKKKGPKKNPPEKKNIQDEQEMQNIGIIIEKKTPVDGLGLKI